MPAVVSSAPESRMRPVRLVHFRSIVAVLAAALAVASLVACAQGTSGADDDDDRVDARRVDARVVDARPVDARPVDARSPDASTGLDGGLPGLDGGLPGGSCTQNSDCTVMGECCFGGLVCVPGTPLPPPINCLPN